MVTFINNKMTVIRYEIRDFTVSDKALDQRNIDDPGRLPPPAADNSNLFRINVQEGSQPFDPLIEQFAPVDEDKRISGASGEKRCRYNGFPESGRGSKNAVIMRKKCVEGFQLWSPQFSLEGQFRGQRPADFPTVFQNNIGAVAFDELDCFLKATPRQCHVSRMKFGARYDPRLAEGRQTHGLSTIKLGILESCQTNELCNQGRRELCPIYVYLIRDHDLDALRYHSLYPAGFAATGRRHSPGLVSMLVFHRHPDTENPTRQFRLVGDPDGRISREPRQG
jgi:hypothetical protein